eukprot:TRINITY_DN1177_c0_g2_i4.p1 TRINITY_DN1177_c0_g2~~TRINITY_DN1177_c0_g2_i4.p1  ORF type:complete len:384 (+),score=129.80 TRINITY_DN1177_c0_g2_i4:1661-2812(+)
MGDELTFVHPNSAEGLEYFKTGQDVLNIEKGYAHFLSAFLCSTAFDVNRIPILEKVIAPHNLEAAFPYLVDDLAEIVEKTWVGSGTTEFFVDLYRFVLKMSSRLVTGEELHSKYFEELAAGFAGVDRHFGPKDIVLPWARYKRFKSAGDLNRLFERVLLERIDQGLIKDDPLQKVIESATTTDGKFLMEEATNTLVAFLFASQTNTATTSGWVLLNLIKHPQWMRAVKEEYERVFAGGKPTFSAISELKVLERVVYESMRLAIFQPTFRKAVKPLTIGKLQVEEGSVVISSMGLLHQDEKNFASVEEFNPDRFLDGMPAAFGGFGIGKHPCPGRKMALMEIRLLVCTVLSRYDIATTKFPAVNKNSMHGTWPLERADVLYTRI